MSTSNTGGSAFPEAGPMGSTGGMTLRDYFAAQALPQILAMSANGTLSSPNGETTQADIAKAAYAFADAMLVARDEYALPPALRSDADF